jgi:hypothetical protein
MLVVATVSGLHPALPCTSGRELLAFWKSVNVEVADNNATVASAV